MAIERRTDLTEVGDVLRVKGMLSNSGSELG